ncbi:hypothetical protein SCLARK_001242 [Spiroplasma clarkii]|nr:hypothetical protein [Spiroplasma clarkii]ARU91792.1 hypothetical protein SCLARK_001242 [Spiroplasma clarkii]
MILFEREMILDNDKKFSYLKNLLDNDFKLLDKNQIIFGCNGAGKSSISKFIKQNNNAVFYFDQTDEIEDFKNTDDWKK